jgi:hypothetical protein
LFQINELRSVFKVFARAFGLGKIGILGGENGDKASKVAAATPARQSRKLALTCVMSENTLPAWF